MHNYFQWLEYFLLTNTLFSVLIGSILVILSDSKHMKHVPLEKAENTNLFHNKVLVSHVLPEMSVTSHENT